MTKLTLQKETKATGDIFYHIRRDDRYVQGSASMNYEEAKKMYDYMVKTNNTEPIIEILETNEINENNTNDK